MRGQFANAMQLGTGEMGGEPVACAQSAGRALPVRTFGVPAPEMPPPPSSPAQPRTELNAGGSLPTPRSSASAKWRRAGRLRSSAGAREQCEGLGLAGSDVTAYESRGFWTSEGGEFARWGIRSIGNSPLELPAVQAFMVSGFIGFGRGGVVPAQLPRSARSAWRRLRCPHPLKPGATANRAECGGQFANATQRHRRN
jgi:hypothetical protein